MDFMRFFFFTSVCNYSLLFPSIPRLVTFLLQCEKDSIENVKQIRLVFHITNETFNVRSFSFSGYQNIHVSSMNKI